MEWEDRKVEIHHLLLPCLLPGEGSDLNKINFFILFYNILFYNIL